MMRGLTIVLLSIVSVFFLQSCNDQDGTSGRLIINMTDAPFDFTLVKEANVTINKIELRNKDSEGANFVILSEEEVSLNLLDLQNGIVQELVNLEVPAGNYDLIRLYISESGLVLNDEKVYDLKVPSSAQSGLKVFVHPNIEVTSGLTTELLLDFDVSKSFVPKGNLVKEEISGFNFKPVVRAVNISFAGRIEGIVADSTEAPIADAKVWIESDTVVASTFAEEDGFYALTGIPAGEFTLKSSKEGYDTLTVEGVTVQINNVTTQDVEINVLEE